MSEKEREILQGLDDMRHLELNPTYKVKIINGILDLYNKEKEKNKEIKEYIEEKMYIDDNPTIYGDEEDTITELPISLNLWNEDLRKLLELLEEE